jgi:hypothetical protein
LGYPEGINVSERNAGERLGLLRGVLESMWFKKILLFIGAFGVLKPGPQLPVGLKTDSKQHREL